MSTGAVANPVPPGLYELSRECRVYTDTGYKNFVIYGTESAKKHSGGDDKETLRLELQRALNAPPSKQVNQSGGVVRVRINDEKGYVVFKLNDPGPNTATIFHYHRLYSLDEPHSK